MAPEQKKEAETGLESRFAALFRERAPRKSEKKNLEENIAWAYMIDHLDESMTGSVDLDTLLIADYCLGITRGSDDRLYKMIRKGAQSLLEYCAEKISGSDIKECKEAESGYGEESDPGTGLSIASSMLYRIYLGALNDMKYASLIDDARDIDDLKSIVFMDHVLRMICEKPEDILGQDKSLKEKARDIAAAYCSYLKTKETEIETENNQSMHHTDACPVNDHAEISHKRRHPHTTKYSREQSRGQIRYGRIAGALAMSAVLGLCMYSGKKCISHSGNQSSSVSYAAQPAKSPAVPAVKPRSWFGWQSEGNSGNDKKTDADTAPEPCSETTINESSKEWIYVVNKDDTLYAISRKITDDYRNFQAIADYNHIDDPNLILVNQYLMIPEGLVSYSQELHHTGFLSGLNCATDEALPREYYLAKKGESLDDIVYKVTGDASKTEAIFQYNSSMNPTFSRSIEYDSHIHFPPGTVRESSMLISY